MAVFSSDHYWNGTGYLFLLVHEKFCLAGLDLTNIFGYKFCISRTVVQYNSTVDITQIMRYCLSNPAQVASRRLLIGSIFDASILRKVFLAKVTFNIFSSNFLQFIFFFFSRCFESRQYEFPRQILCKAHISVFAFISFLLSM